MTLPQPPRLRAYLRLLAVNVIVAACLLGIAFKSWSDIRERRALVYTVAERQCLPAPAPTTTTAGRAQPRPPENIAREGYVGEFGHELTRAALMTELDVVRADGSEERAPLGDLSVLSSGDIHVVNLWAPWCRPCQEELPGLKNMFARHAAEWRDAVQFVPVKVLDSDNPALAYAQVADISPPSRARLADRSLNDALVHELRSDPERTLYRGQLPVSFVLDCDRRVRWAQFGPLSAQSLADLEDNIDRLLAERQTPGACRRVWCGNGRCDVGERNCTVDCGAPRARVSTPVEQATDLPIAAVNEPAPLACPKNCVRCDADNNCLFGLKPAPRRQTSPLPDSLTPVAPCPKHCARCDAQGTCLFGLKM